MNGDKSATISKLVQQLKSGSITKAQLFSELSQLQTQPISSEKQSGGGQLHPVSGFTSPDRREIVHRLVDERRPKPKSTNLVSNEAGKSQNNAQVLSHDPTNAVSMHEFMINSQVRVPSHVERDSSHVERDSSSFYSNTLEKPSKDIPMYPNVSVDLSSNEHELLYPSDIIRENRNDRTELDKRVVQMAECTFKPNIRSLPACYGPLKGGDVPFHSRAMRWKEKKESECEKKKQKNIEEQLDGCTFVPVINKKSKETRHKMGSKEIPVTERLFKDTSKIRIIEELSAEAKFREEAEFRRLCTFKPQTNTANWKDSAHILPRYRQKKKEITAKSEEYSFTPRVNEIGRHMGSAQMYIQTDIFERLSRPYTKSVTQGSQDDLCSLSGCEESEFLEETRNQNMYHQRPKSAPRERSKSSLQSSGSSSQLTSQELEERRKSFQSFLYRQELCQKDKKNRMLIIQKTTDPIGKPKINEHSIRLTEKNHVGSFMQRLARNTLKKEHEANRKKKKSLEKDPECTFSPSICKKSAQMVPRSVNELSRGDLLKKEAAQRMMKLKAEQHEMSGLTFKPQLNKKSMKAESKLKIATEPDTYVQRLQQQAKALSEKQRTALQQQEMNEVAECTFQPKIHEAPAYVSRIAKSMALTRAAKASTTKTKKEKPEWK